MGFTTAVKTCYQKYFTFSGRARRAELWYFYLFQLILWVAFAAVMIGMVSSGGDSALGGTFLFIAIGVLVVATAIPSLTVSIRRLHDMNYSGWWYALTFVPYIGGIAGLVFLVMFTFRGTDGQNRFGPDPLLDPNIGSSQELGEVFA